MVKLRTAITVIGLTGTLLLMYLMTTLVLVLLKGYTLTDANLVFTFADGIKLYLMYCTVVLYEYLVIDVDISETKKVLLEAYTALDLLALQTLIVVVMTTLADNDIPTLPYVKGTVLLLVGAWLSISVVKLVIIVKHASNRYPAIPKGARRYELPVWFRLTLPNPLLVLLYPIQQFILMIEIWDRMKVYEGRR